MKITAISACGIPLALSLCGAACSGVDGGNAATLDSPSAGAPSSLAAPSGPAVKRVLRSGARSRLSFQVAPRAACTLHATDDADPSHGTKLFADDRGLVRVYGETTAPEGVPLSLALDCTGDDGVAVRTPIEVRTGDPADDAPEPAVEPVGAKLPALEGADLELPDEVLVARGYPLRPDPSKRPKDYALWLRMVSHPFTSVASGGALRPEVKFGNSFIDPHWTGLQISNVNPNDQFYYIVGSWPISPVSAPPASLTAYSVPTASGYWSATYGEWVGIDDSEIEQCGSMALADTFDIYSPFGNIPFTVYRYGLWTETFPGPVVAVTNVTPNEGDVVTAQVTIADANGHTWIDPNTGRVTSQNNTTWFELYDWNQNAVVQVTNPLLQRYSGNNAEWIIERMGVLALADFGSNQMFNVSAEDSLTGYADPYYTPGMVNDYLMLENGDVLATASQEGAAFGAKIGFNWWNYQ